MSIYQSRRGARRNAISVVLTLFVISLLVITSPVRAVTLTTTLPPTADVGDAVDFTVSIDLETYESVPFTHFTVTISDGLYTEVCVFGIDGNVLSGCTDVDVSVLIDETNWHYGDREGNEYEYGYGYGYGGVAGIDLVWNVTWNTTGLAPGAYTVSFNATAENGVVGNYEAPPQVITLTASGPVDDVDPVITDVTVDGIPVNAFETVNITIRDAEQNVTVEYLVIEENMAQNLIILENDLFGSQMVIDRGTENETTAIFEVPPGFTTVTLYAVDQSENEGEYVFFINGSVVVNMSEVTGAISTIPGVNSVTIIDSEGNDISGEEEAPLATTATIVLEIDVGGILVETQIVNFSFADVDFEQAASFLVQDKSTPIATLVEGSGGITLELMLQYQNYTRFLPEDAFQGVMLRFAQTPTLNFSANNFTVIWIANDAGTEAWTLRNRTTAPTFPITTSNMGYIENGTHVRMWIPHLSGIGVGNDTFAPNITIPAQTPTDSMFSLTFSAIEANPKTTAFCTYTFGDDSGSLDLTDFTVTGTLHEGSVAFTGYENDDYVLNITCTDLADQVGNAVRTITVNDTTPPVQSDAGASSITTSAATIAITTNEDATCKYHTSDVAYDSMTRTFSTTGGTSHTNRLTGLSSSRSYTYYVRCQDVNGNAADSTTISFTTSSSSVFFGGGGGGGGIRIPPATPPVELPAQAQRRWSENFFSLVPGLAARLSPARDVTAVGSLDLLVKRAVNDVTLSLESFTGVPPGVPVGARPVLEYLLLESDVPTDAIDGIRVAFTVPKSWLIQNQYETEHVRLAVHDGNGWQLLPTSLTGESSGTASYAAVTTTTGALAITLAERVVEQPVETSPPVIEPEFVTPPEEQVVDESPIDAERPDPWLFWTGVLWVLIVLVAALLYVHKRK